MGMPIVPNLNAFGAAPGERIFRDSLIAREASTSRTTLAGGLAALILLGVPLVLLALNALVGACGDMMRDSVAAPLTALWDVAVGYIRTVGPWLLPILALGVLLGWLRRYAARHDYVLVLSLGPTQQMRFGLQSAFPVLLVPVAVWVVAQRLAAAQQLNITIILLAAFPLWVLSGVAVDVAWEGATAWLLRRLSPLPPAMAMAVAVRTVLQAERDLETARIRDVAADPVTGTVYIRGQFEDAEQQRRAQQLCEKVAGVKSVQVTAVEADE